MYPEERRNPPVRSRPAGRPPNRPPMQKPPRNMNPRGQANYGPQTRTKADIRKARYRAAEAARYSRWSKNRLAIPYSTEGPKITFGIFWFFYVVTATLAGDFLDRPAITPVVVAIMLSPIAGLAALQVANCWYGSYKETRSWAAFIAYLLAVSGFGGITGLFIGIVIAFVLCFISATLADENRTTGENLDLLIRAVFPAGIAVASMSALCANEYQSGEGAYVLLSLVLLVSSYEAGDFLVGSGSNNAFEGPISGLIALFVSGFSLYMLTPKAFPTGSSIILFILLTALCCPLGQMLASGLLPKSTSWAPALRRLDSYIVSAPLWLILVVALGY